MQFALTPGTHVFTIKPGTISNTYEQTVNVVENQTQFFEFELPSLLLSNAFHLGSNITRRTAAEANTDLVGLQAVK